MNSSTARQRYLYLVARLYDLAAEFSEAELTNMQAAYLPDDSNAVLESIRLLKRFHGIKPERLMPDAENRHAREKSPRPQRQDEPSNREAWNDRALVALFEDKALFPSVGDIASVLPASLAAKPKEARDRYVRRVMKYVTSLSNAEKVDFQAKLRSFISRKPAGFVSRWKTLIQDL
jgi:hypothetical protein